MTQQIPALRADVFRRLRRFESTHEPKTTLCEGRRKEPGDGARRRGTGDGFTSSLPGRFARPPRMDRSASRQTDLQPATIEGSPAHRPARDAHLLGALAIVFAETGLRGDAQPLLRATPAAASPRASSPALTARSEAPALSAAGPLVAGHPRRRTVQPYHVGQARHRPRVIEQVRPREHLPQGVPRQDPRVLPSKYGGKNDHLPALLSPSSAPAARALIAAGAGAMSYGKRPTFNVIGAVAWSGR